MMATRQALEALLQELKDCARELAGPGSRHTPQTRRPSRSLIRLSPPSIFEPDGSTVVALHAIQRLIKGVNSRLGQYGNKIMTKVIEIGGQRLAVVGLVIDFGYTFLPPANPAGCACGNCENCRYYSAEFIRGTYPLLNSPIKNFYLPFIKRLAVTDADCVHRN